MSFKREGNDPALLHLLKKRRVEELSSVDIPIDEAKKLKDGRFTCLVCGSQHIFDTISILQIHRNSTKHNKNLKYFQRRKVEMLQQIESRLADNDKHKSDLLEKRASLLGNNTQTICNRKHYKSNPKKYQPKPKLQLMTKEKSQKRDESIEHREKPKNDHPIPNPQNQKTCLDRVAKTMPFNNAEEYKSRQNMTAEEKAELTRKEIEKRSQGWVRNRAGEWEKDPNVEFDSDEDELPT
uniref:Sodium channel modifier 1 n=1 Tax=Phallusia mammillata TaxID=59560 RepID=A0A6F9DSB7_9ASCI|nr:Sodium channel modifier 1 [Phallusia mammillata]